MKFATDKNTKQQFLEFFLMFFWLNFCINLNYFDEIDGFKFILCGKHVLIQLGEQ